MSGYSIQPIAQPGHPWVSRLASATWGGTGRVVSRGRLHQVDRLAGFLALLDPVPAAAPPGTAESLAGLVQEGLGGLLTYQIDGTQCEVVTLNSLVEGIGIGGALIEAARQAAIAAGCGRLWLITTNDNLPALGFYQKRGFRIAAIHPGSIDEYRRRLKPEISPIGLGGIPIRDEIELEIDLPRPQGFSKPLGSA